MEWAAGIDTSSECFRTIVVRKSEIATLELKHLVSRGVPRGGETRLTIRGNFLAWRLADPSEYLRGFDFHHVTLKENRHVVYEVVSDDLRILIPALVVMRALFRPTKYLLPTMFQPQALDHVRFLNVSNAPPSVEFYSQTWRNLRGRYADVELPISWMSAFPTAMAFAASVHMNAREGRIAVSLPNAHASLGIRGRTKDGLLLATGAELISLEAAEEPLDWAAGHTKSIYKRATHRQSGGARALKVDIPSRPDGLIDLSDDEWNVVKPIVLSSGWKPTRHDPRALFNGILRKLVLGTGWRTTPYPTGGTTHALFAYRRLARTGTLDAALAAVCECRQRACATDIDGSV